jgi:arylsulfatase A-like enzyme
MRTAKLRASILALAMLCWGCAEAPPPHLVLFTADTLRPDHLSLNGYARETSPRIDAFARQAWHFAGAFSVIPKTAPSFATMFTGRHPRQHGVRWNFGRIPEGLPLLAERLREAGYRTAAFVGNPALRESRGFARGFDTWAPVPGGVAPLLDAFFLWAEAPWDAPTFVWIHTLDPHGPYEPPAAYEGLFLGDAHSGSNARVPRGYAVDPEHPEKVLGAVPRYQQRPDGEDRVSHYVARYDAEIRLVDDAFGRVLDFLRARGLYDAGAILFSSDHGESLGEHDYYFEHGWFAYEPGLRIPWLLKTPGQTRGQRVDAPVSNLDFLPTALALAGLDPDVPLEGRNLLSGSLDDAPVVVENSDRYPQKFFGLRTATEKYLRSDDGAVEELYDLSADPGETVDRIRDRPERARALAAELDRRLEALGASAEIPARGAPDDAATSERLRALGYVE